MVLNTITVSQIQYAYSRLKELRADLGMDMDFMLEVETLTSAFVTAYGKLYSETTGTTKLRSSNIPEDLRKTHDEIMTLRHERYAHNGAHSSISPTLEFKVTDDAVEMSMAIGMTMCLGAPEHWEALIDWHEKIVVETVRKQLAHLSKETGRLWSWAKYSPPGSSE